MTKDGSSGQASFSIALLKHPPPCFYHLACRESQALLRQTGSGSTRPHFLTQMPEPWALGSLRLSSYETSYNFVSATFRLCDLRLCDLRLCNPRLCDRNIPKARCPTGMQLVTMMVEARVSPRDQRVKHYNSGPAVTMPPALIGRAASGGESLEACLSSGPLLTQI